MNAVTRYHPLLVALHWLLAVLVVVMLAMGMVVLQGLPNSAPDKLNALRGHMVVGCVILLLMVLRVAARLRFGRPAPAPTCHAALDRLAALAHTALYLLVFAMAFSGIGIALAADLPQVLFAGSGVLPSSFAGLPPRIAHGVFAWALIATLVLHLCGVLYHHIVQRDPVLKRMAWSRRAAR